MHFSIWQSSFLEIFNDIPLHVSQSSNVIFYRNYQGKKFIVSALVMHPYFDGVVLPKNEDGIAIIEPKDSIDYRLIDTASRKMNFSYVFQEPKDGQWG